MATFVLDCSAALTLVLPDERSPSESMIERALIDGGALAPSIWPLEICNALLVAERRDRIDRRFRLDTLADLARLPVVIDPETAAHALGATAELAERHELTAYDAAYLELALRTALPLATHDNALARAAQAERLTLMLDQA